MDSWAFRYIVRPYLQHVKGRNAATLLLIIQRNVQPDSLVYIDEWAAYKQNQRALGFNQQTVNQSLNFVDSVTSVHTQHLTSFKLCFSNFNVLGQNSVITAISHYVALFFLFYVNAMLVQNPISLSVTIPTTFSQTFPSLRFF